MTSTPIIAIPADVREADGYRWHAAAEPYLAALTGIGAIPLIVPALGERIDLETVLARIDGVLLPGSRSNVHPEAYGRGADPRAEPYDAERDAVSLPLARLAVRRGVPLFAICRGMQELNVALGGTLVPRVHEIEGRLDHRAPQAERQVDRFAIRHTVDLAAGGTLRPILGSDTIRVNSLHQQGVDQLAEGLVVEALAPDGTIEAVRVAEAPDFAVGVQWHPEYWVETDQPSAELFAAFGEAVRAYMASRGTVPTAAA